MTLVTVTSERNDILALVHGRANWNVHITNDDVVELESSTPTKFSRHVLVTLPNAAFATNAAAGHFVRQLLNYPQVYCYGLALRCLDALLFSTHQI